MEVTFWVSVVAVLTEDGADILFFLINSLMVSGVVVVSTEDGIDWASGAHAAVARDQHDQHDHHCA